MSKTKIKLKFPVTVKLKAPDGGEEREEKITELAFRRPKARDMKMTDGCKGDIEKTIRLAAILSGQPEAVIEELDGVDFMAVAELCEGFF